MDRQGLLQLMRTIQSSSTADAGIIKELVRQYPYSQVLHALAAKTSSDHALADASDLLTISATYSSNRSVLKSLMSLPRQVGSAEVAVVPETDGARMDAETIRRELSHDLKRLQKVKTEFELSLERFEHRKSTPSYPAAKDQKSKKKRSLDTKGKEKNKKAELGKQKKTKAAGSLPGKGQKKKEVRAVDSELLLSSIESYRGKPKKTIKNIKQIEIIDRFIKIQPTIVRQAGTSKNDVDLSQKSVELGGEVVSVTLADLLVRQGKKERAIEVLKKLIWKYPQKRAIFAARIEDLKR